MKKLTSLMKEKYGVMKVAPLKLKYDDPVNIQLRKIASYIYKVGDWTEEDVREGIQQAVLSRYAAEIQEKLEVKLEPMSEATFKQYPAFRSYHKGYRLEIMDTFTQQKLTNDTTYYLVDTATNKQKNHNARFYVSAYPEVKFYTGYEQYLIGVAKLKKDLLRYYEQNQELFEAHQVSFNEYKSKVDSMCNGIQQKDAKFFKEKTPNVILGVEKPLSEHALRHNFIRAQIQKYIDHTYNIVRQQNYEAEIDKMTRASAWQTKKNINDETKSLMENTSLKDFFHYVELDNDVDLELYSVFEKEMQSIYPLLPKTNEVADLRLRKLGNYQALGLYHSMSHTIALDFRSGKDRGKDKNNPYAPNEPGIASFIHEYGHFLDFTVDVENGNLSMQEAFQPILQRYQQNLNRLDKDSFVKARADYYSTPTEVFARAFEVYTAHLGLQSSFLRSSKSYELLEQYQLFDESIRPVLYAYFDQQFPEYRKQIEAYQSRNLERTSMAEVSKEMIKQIVTENPIITDSKGENVESFTIRKVEDKTNEKVESSTSGKVENSTSGKVENSTKIAKPQNQVQGSIRTHEERKDFLNQINQLDIVEVAARLGMDLVKQGQSYTWATHDSFVIDTRKNYFYWNAQGIGGNAVKLVQTIQNVSFKQALKWLQEQDFTQVKTFQEKPREPFRYYLKETNRPGQGTTYLKDERGISDTTIQLFKSQGALAEGTNHSKDGYSEPVLSFKSYNPEGKLVGATFQGVVYNVERYPKKGRMKLILPNSDGYQGVKVTLGEQPKHFIFAESPIDLMSYLDLHPELFNENVQLVSMNGLKEGVIYQTLKDQFNPNYPGTAEEYFKDLDAKMNAQIALEKGFKITLAIDNDAAAQRFVERFRPKNFPLVLDLPSKEANEEKKDWNDMLLESREKAEEIDAEFTEVTDREELAKMNEEIIDDTRLDKSEDVDTQPRQEETQEAVKMFTEAEANQICDVIMHTPIALVDSERELQFVTMGQAIKSHMIEAATGYHPTIYTRYNLPESHKDLLIEDPNSNFFVFGKKRTGGTFILGLENQKGLFQALGGSSNIYIAYDSIDNHFGLNIDSTTKTFHANTQELVYLDDTYSYYLKDEYIDEEENRIKDIPMDERDVTYLNELEKNLETNQTLETVMEAHKQDVIAEVQQNSEYLTKEEVTQLLDEHFQKVEKLLATVNVASEANHVTTKQIIQQFLQELKALLKSTKQKMTTMVTNKLDKLESNLEAKRVFIKNSVNEQVLKLSDLMKNTANKLDTKFALEVSHTQEQAIDTQKNEAIRTFNVTVNRKENAMEMRLKKAREGDKALKANQATQMQQETQDIDEKISKVR
ncbi:toprim domain-containing protein [Enterococcus cecorum]|nr:toprim domain-containing protein [Enterococcus cecorum]